MVGYPFPGTWAVTVDAPTPRGFTHADLHAQLVRVYAAMYEEAAIGEGPTRYNQRIESRFGVAFHRIEDLVVEAIVYAVRKGNATAWIQLGS